MISQYIEQSTGLRCQDLDDITLCDWVKRSTNREFEPYKVNNPRLLSPRGSVNIVYDRFFGSAQVDDYINKI